jgi:hypothetical protein
LGQPFRLAKLPQGCAKMLLDLGFTELSHLKAR